MADRWGMGFRQSILLGYWPEWVWYRGRFEWRPTPALLQHWIDNCEIG